MSGLKYLCMQLSTVLADMGGFWAGWSMHDVQFWDTSLKRRKHPANVVTVMVWYSSGRLWHVKGICHSCDHPLTHHPLENSSWTQRSKMKLLHTLLSNLTITNSKLLWVSVEVSTANSSFGRENCPYGRERSKYASVRRHFQDQRGQGTAGNGSSIETTYPGAVS